MNTQQPPRRELPRVLTMRLGIVDELVGTAAPTPSPACREECGASPGGWAGALARSRQGMAEGGVVSRVDQAGSATVGVARVWSA